MMLLDSSRNRRRLRAPVLAGPGGRQEGGELGPGLRVVHVAESFASGVADAINSYAKAVPEAEHHLVYSLRSDAPIDSGDFSAFASAQLLPPGHASRVRCIRAIARRAPGAVFHAHSSYAGAYVRFALSAGRRRRIVYTPHCYGFERRDIGPVARAALKLAEGVLAQNTSAFAACSPREMKLSRWPMARAQLVTVPNVARTVLAAPDAKRFGDVDKLVVASAGRLGAQKDPQFFIDSVLAVRAAGLEIEAVWIGGGSVEDEQRLLDAGVTLSGWLDREEASLELRRADVYLHTGAWEGFPLTVLEAASLGLPTIVRAIPAFDDMELAAVVSTPRDAADVLRGLYSGSIRQRLAEDSQRAFRGHNLEAQRRALVAAWVGMHE